MIPPSVLPSMCEFVAVIETVVVLMLVVMAMALPGLPASWVFVSVSDGEGVPVCDPPR